MTISPPSVLLGAQHPAVLTVPPRVSSAGQEAVELAASAGLILDPWQALVLTESLGERPDGKWSSFEVGLVVPRQNGKGSILEARELAGLFLFGEELLLHSAHEFKTSSEAFRRVLSLIQNTPDLEKRVAKIRTSHGEEGIELRGGQRLRFVARSTGSGRGFSADLVVLDEAYNLGPEAMAALLPTMAARVNPQIWYASSAPLVNSPVLRAVCKRGRVGSSSLAYFEWSAPADASSDDMEAVAFANPGLGIRITPEFTQNEREALEEPEFRRERMGVWFDEDAEHVIDPKRWQLLADPGSQLADPTAMALDVSPDRRWSSIAAAGLRRQGGRHVEVIERRKGTGWVVDRLAELVAKHKPSRVVLDPAGPAGSLLKGLEEANIDVQVVSAREHGQACGMFYDGTVGDASPVHHLDQAELNAALSGAKQRPLGDAWAWNRKDSTVDISPLVAVTLALWAASATPAEVDVAANVW